MSLSIEALENLSANHGPFFCYADGNRAVLNPEEGEFLRRHIDSFSAVLRMKQQNLERCIENQVGGGLTMQFKDPQKASELARILEIRFPSARK